MVCHELSSRVMLDIQQVLVGKFVPLCKSEVIVTLDHIVVLCFFPPVMATEYLT